MALLLRFYIFAGHVVNFDLISTPPHCHNLDTLAHGRFPRDIGTFAYRSSQRIYSLTPHGHGKEKSFLLLDVSMVRFWFGYRMQFPLLCRGVPSLANGNIASI